MIDSIPKRGTFVRVRWVDAIMDAVGDPAKPSLGVWDTPGWIHGRKTVRAAGMAVDCLILKACDGQHHGGINTDEDAGYWCIPLGWVAKITPMVEGE